MWNSSSDLLSTIHDAHQRLITKETDAISAHAEARLLNSATRLLAISLENARLTGSLAEGSRILPSLDIEHEPGLPAINGSSVTQALPASREPS